MDSLSYLVVFQILVVTGLCLAFLWLAVRRARGTAPKVSEPEIAPSALDDDEGERLRAQVRLLEEENARMKSLVDENRILRDKTKYLEARLAETEVERIEMGVISAIRAENERLKQELGRARESAAKPPLSTVDPVPAPVDPKLHTLLS